jgi:hypothetical protein
MNPIPYFVGFAWIAIVALSLSVLTDNWIPMLAGAVLITVLIRIAK